MKVPMKVESEVDIRVLKVNAKCSDCCFVEVLDAAGETVKEHDGYVPGFFPGEHYGDYLELEIDIATGTILNWTPPSAEVLAKFIADDAE